MRCADVTWEMQDDHFGESAATARLGDLVWHYKGVLGGHVLTREEERTEGWTTYTTLLCECGEAEAGDHHVVLLARGPESSPTEEARREIDRFSRPPWEIEGGLL